MNDGDDISDANENFFMTSYGTNTGIAMPLQVVAGKSSIASASAIDKDLSESDTDSDGTQVGTVLGTSVEASRAVVESFAANDMCTYDEDSSVSDTATDSTMWLSIIRSRLQHIRNLE